MILEYTDLWAEAVLQHQIEIPVAIQICYGERTAIFGKIQTAYSGVVDIMAITTDVEHVRLRRAPGPIFANVLIDCIPAVLIRRCRARIHRRFRNHLAPEESHGVARTFVREHAACDENFG